MNQMKQLHLRRYAALMLAAGVALPAISGCSSQPRLTLNSVDHTSRLKQSFSHAYFSRDENGDYQVVLVQRDMVEPGDEGHAGAPLMPSARPPLRQIVQLRLLWQPPHAAKADHPAATNAAINWCMVYDDGSQGANVIEYGGTGFIVMSPGRDKATVVIRAASLHSKLRRGEMADPIGDALLEGSFTAYRDDEQVALAISEMKAITSGAANAQAPTGFPATTLLRTVPAPTPITAAVGRP